MKQNWREVVAESKAKIKAREKEIREKADTPREKELPEWMQKHFRRRRDYFRK